MRVETKLVTAASSVVLGFGPVVADLQKLLRFLFVWKNSLCSREEATG